MKGLANENVQSASFKMLQKALEMDTDLTQVHGSARAPRDQQGRTMHSGLKFEKTV